MANQEKNQLPKVGHINSFINLSTRLVYGSMHSFRLQEKTYRALEKHYTYSWWWESQVAGESYHSNEKNSRGCNYVYYLDIVYRYMSSHPQNGSFLSLKTRKLRPKEVQIHTTNKHWSQDSNSISRLLALNLPITLFAFVLLCAVLWLESLPWCWT